MLNLNGVIYYTLEDLGAALDAIDGLSQESRTAIINDFNGTPNEPIESVPASITPRQIRLALVRSGVSISQIESFINSLPEPNRSEALIWWEYATEFLRDNQMLNTMAGAMGIEQEELDAIFMLGKTL